jgi:hypothetical protein
MPSLLPKFLVMLLVLLQLVAPLVHAHTGKHILAGSGSSQNLLHVPGLEMLSAFSGKEAQLQATTVNVYPEGLVVGVNAGLKLNLGNFQLDDASDGYFLHQQAFVFKAVITALTRHPYPQISPVTYRLLLTAHSPRAPPAQ